MTFGEMLQTLPEEEQKTIVAEVMGLTNLFATRMEAIKATIATAHMVSLGFYEGAKNKLEEIVNDEIKENSRNFTQRLNGR